MNLPIIKIISEDLRALREVRNPRGDYWYASELGGCARKACYARRGIKPSKEKTDRELRIFAMGDLVESFLLDRFYQKIGYDVGGKTIAKIERNPTTANDEKLQVHGKPDMVVSYSDNSQEIIEAKSIHSRGFNYLNGRAKEYHEFQLWWYLYKLNIEQGLFVYFSKDDMRIEQFPLRLSNEEIAKKVMEKINYLNQHWADNKLPPKSQEGGLCSPKWCEYWDICQNKNIKK